jgi:hypothetical protein
MRQEPGTGPPGVHVQRQFEGNRLAKDSQARAYQKVLSVVCRPEARAPATYQVVGTLEESNRVSPEGVAA